mgnify:CR=1 FL=1
MTFHLGRSLVHIYVNALFISVFYYFKLRDILLEHYEYTIHYLITSLPESVANELPICPLAITKTTVNTN